MTAWLQSSAKRKLLTAISFLPVSERTSPELQATIPEIAPAPRRNSDLVSVLSPEMSTMAFIIVTSFVPKNFEA